MCQNFENTLRSRQRSEETLQPVFENLLSKVDTMEEKTVMNHPAGGGPESRDVLNKYYSVQFCVNGMDTAYLFKLRDIPLNGLCILVREDSPVLKELKVGDILSMGYHPVESPESPKELKTRVISKSTYDRFSGHSLIGLSILEQDGHS